MCGNGLNERGGQTKWFLFFYCKLLSQKLGTCSSLYPYWYSHSRIEGQGEDPTQLFGILFFVLFLKDFA